MDEKVPILGVGQLLKPYQKSHSPLAMGIVKETSLATKTAGEEGFIPISVNMGHHLRQNNSGNSIVKL